MRYATVGTFVFGGLLLFGFAVVAAEPERVDLFTSGEGGYGRYRIPALLVTEKRTLLALCEGRRKAGGLTGDIDLVLRRSPDGGGSWLPLQVVADHGTDTLGNPCIVQDRTTETLWLLFTKSPGDFTEKQIVASETPTSTTVWVTRSTDDGATWSAATEITATTKRDDWRWYGTGPGHGQQLASGRLLIPCYHSVADTQIYRSHSVFSDDHGATWELGGVIGDHTSEPQALARADGSIVLNARSIDKQGFRTLATSTDDGTTWTDVRLDPTLTCPSCEGSLIEYASGQNGERKTWLFSNPPGPGRRNLTLRASSDEGATWPIAKVLDAGSTEYSSLARLPDGRVGVLYERSPGTVYRVIISFLRLDLDWLTQ